MNLPLSRELALRIGLAARSLPETDAATLIGVLHDAVGLPLDEDKLAALKLKDLRKADGGRLMPISQDALKATLDILKGGIDTPADDLPQIEAYAEGDLPGSIRVAIASNTAEQLDGHFGSCKRFLIYEVSPDALRLIDIRNAAQPDDIEIEKNVYRTDLIKDCQVLFVNSIGGPAAAKVVRDYIQPLKQPQAGPAREAAGRLQQVLAGSPPPWLAHVMGREAASLDPFRAAALEEDDA